MKEFEEKLNDLLVDTFNNILKFEESSVRMSTNQDITMAETHMIEVVAKKGNCSVSDVANYLGITVPSATVAIKKLEKKGLVLKQSCSVDGRKFIVSLTELGSKINKTHSIFHKKMVKNISRIFSDSEREVLLVAIEKLNKFFIEKVDA